jgi:tetratricopeptide (TPR) repeat protein
MLGNLYLGKGDLASAGQQYERALGINPNFAIAAANLALVQAKEGSDLNVALGLAQRAKQLMPDLESISDTLAWIEHLKGSNGSAIPLLQECVRKAPEQPVYRYHLGMALLAGGEKGQAKTQLDAALRLNLSGEDALQARKALALID